MAFDQQQINAGLFIPTTIQMDVARLYQVSVTSEEFKELLVRLYETVNTIALAINVKDSAYYSLQEFLNGQLLFPNTTATAPTDPTPVFRQIYRKVVDFGALPNTTSKSVAHNINIASAQDSYAFTRIYACATDPVTPSYIPIPYASAAGTDDIQLEVNATNVIITTASDKTAYTTCYVVLEYIKQL